mgnify:CR=1 FL=1
MTLPDNVVQVTELSKKFPNGPQALDRVSLEVPKGQLLSLIGLSGSGKSTMMNLIGCLDRPSKGSVKIAGDSTNELTDNQLTSLRSKAIGFVFQQFQLLPNTTAIENVMAPLLYQGISAKQARVSAKAILKRLGLADRLNFDRIVSLVGNSSELR